jgi:hypothetical protein
MIAREKIIIGLPVMNYLVDVACMEGMFNCLPFYGGRIVLGGCSDIQLARTEIANRFVEKYTNFDWLMFIDADTGFSLDDWKYLWEGDEDIVIAPYAKKILGKPPVEFGMGFCRIHRSVFERLKELRTDDGQDKLPRFYHEGMMQTHYFPAGAFNSRWTGEDQGFYLWAAHTDAKVRLEKRCRLKHFGRFGYGYPDQVPVTATLDDGAQ